MAKRGSKTGGDKVAGSKLSLEQQAAALAYATTCSDAQAAKQYGISVRTLANYRARLHSDPVLAELFETKRSELQAEWKQEALGALRRGLTTMTTLMERLLENEGPPEKGQLFEVTGAVKVLGELLTMKEALGDVAPSAGEDREPEEAEEEGSGEEGGGSGARASADPVH